MGKKVLGKKMLLVGDQGGRPLPVTGTFRQGHMAMWTDGPLSHP